MKLFSTTIATAVALMLSAGASAMENGAQSQKTDAMANQKHESMKMDSAHMQRMMQAWPKASREAVAFMTKKYGPPAAMTSGMAVWGKTGPWKRTIVYGTAVPHNFPGPHPDVMQQFIDYKVPVSMYDELAQYDGSVVLERTSGEMSARCDKEGANFLALNLANDIVTGKRSVADARKMYGEQIMAMKAKKSAPYTEKLLFSASGDTRDPDQALKMMGPMAKDKKKAN
ncbi:MAG: hypothetical protein ACR2J7_02730 [Luteimonas sp.]